MKFKKAFAWILAVAMIISLMPSMAFATTTNTVVKTYAVASDSQMPVVAIDLKVGDSTGIANNATNKFKVTLENAEWASKVVANTAVLADDIAAACDAGNTYANAGIGWSAIDNAGVVTTSSAISASGVTDTTATVTLTNDTGIIPAGEYVRLYLSLKSGTEDGEVNVIIDGRESIITSGTYTVATVGSNTTIAEVVGDITVFPRAAVTADASIEITETSVNAINSVYQILKMTLPKGVKWTSVDVTGDLITADINGGTESVNNFDTINWDTASHGEYVLTNDGRTMYVKLSTSGDASERDSIIIEPSFEITKNAAMGEITVDISGYKCDSVATRLIADASGLVVAEYGDETVTVSTVEDDKLPTIVAGYTEDLKDKVFYVQVSLKENLGEALSPNRYVDFVLPEEVQVLEGTDVIKYSFKKNQTYISATSTDSDDNFSFDSTVDRSTFSLLVPTGKAGDPTLSGWNSSAAQTLTIFIPVTVRADFTGDITLNVSGAKAGVPDTELVVGTVISPITVEAAMTEVKNGVQSQALADITITENVAGYLTASTNNNEVVLDIDTLSLGDRISLTDAKVEVTDGNLAIKNVEFADNTIVFEIKEDSTEPSTISVTGVVAALDRTLPEGPYALRVYGSALIQNDWYNDEDFADPSWVPAGDVCAAKVADYINITTPAEDGVYNSVDSAFVIGATSFTVNGETYEMDAAAYIDENDRTMVPIRYFAMACGIDEDAISWDQASQTATITTPARVIKITMGQDTIWVSDGTNIQMDTVAVNKADRIYVPARFMANALGYEVEWDAATRTVSIF